MTKTLLIISAFLGLAFISVTMYCALIIAKRYRKVHHSKINAEECMLFENYICSNCKTGKETYELDKHSDTCQYIECCKNGNCEFYVPLKKYSKPLIFK